MKIVTAIEEDYSIETLSENTKVFIAGGIKNCPDWQSKLIEMIKEKNEDYYTYEKVTFFNPRRAVFPDDPKTSEEQICWEFKHLEEADIIIYWFSRGLVNPITLFEYGKYLSNNRASRKQIVVGIDPEYEKKQSVEIQGKLERPELDFCYSLEEVIDQLAIELQNRFPW